MPNARARANPPAVWVGGNLGGSLLESLEAIGHRDWIVLELSSFMLEGLREDGWSPAVAVLTNFFPNHLDWHGSVEAYAHAKQAILDFQREHADIAILGPGIREHFQPRARQTVDRTHDAAEAMADARPREGLRVPGEHNRLNAMLAADAVHAALGGAWAEAWDPLRDFPGLEHRLQFIGERGGARYYNDSKSTTPEAAERAIRALHPDRLHLILGGYDKGCDLTALARLAAARCRAIYTVGDTGPAIAAAAEASGGAEVVRCGDLDHAIHETRGRVQPGDGVLLSPACASWDQYAGFEQRGAHFTRAVLEAGQ